MCNKEDIERLREEYATLEEAVRERARKRPNITTAADWGLGQLRGLETAFSILHPELPPLDADLL